MNIQRMDVLRSELDRPSLRSLKYKKDIIGVEIGVQYGINARDILERYNIKTLYLVDPYINYKNTKGNLVEPEGKDLAIKYLNKYKDKIVWVYKLSEEAVDDIPDNLDFVYIDGGHTYEIVKRDLELYYPKVKKGGLFSGHDYAKRAPDVVRAVNEFFSKMNLKLYCGGKWDFWCIKE
jgi:hypothetical protein